MNRRLPQQRVDTGWTASPAGPRRVRGARVRLAAVLLACALLLPAVVAASADNPPPRWWSADRRVPGLSEPAAAAAARVPPDEVLEASGAVIGEIYFQRLDVFDDSRPEESNFVFRSANSLHVTTRESVIEQKLLFRSGDSYSGRQLRETARELRGLEYLFDAWVAPVAYHDNVVDVLVVTRDVWTLGLSAGFSRSGGANSQQVELLDSNVLGSGRLVSLKYSDEPDRSAYRFRYLDSNLFGTRGLLRLWYADNSDGFRRTLDLERPFYSLDARWSAGTRVVDDDRVTRLYAQGDVVRVFREQVTSAEVRGGLSAGYHDGATRRFTFGYSYENHQFSRHPDDPGGVRSFPGHLDRVLSYPWVGYEYAQDRYIETHNLDKLGRTEDYNLGTELSLRLGWSAQALGADRDQAVFSGELHTGGSRRPGELMLFSASTGGRWGSSGDQDVTVDAHFEYYRRNFGRHQLYARLEAGAAWNLDPEDQLLLGGDTGLRGYPRNYQAGDRRFLITLEQRFYSDLQLFQLVYVGAAAFADVGRAWYTQGSWKDRNTGTLRDVGVGLRLSSSRSSRGAMVHFDVAYPLDGDHRKVQWLVTSRDSF